MRLAGWKTNPYQEPVAQHDDVNVEHVREADVEQEVVRKDQPAGVGAASGVAGRSEETVVA